MWFVKLQELSELIKPFLINGPTFDQRDHLNVLLDAEIWPKNVVLSRDIDIFELGNLLNVLVKNINIPSSSLDLHCNHIERTRFTSSVRPK